MAGWESKGFVESFLKRCRNPFRNLDLRLCINLATLRHFLQSSRPKQPSHPLPGHTDENGGSGRLSRIAGSIDPRVSGGTRQPGSEELTIDHVVPRAQGGVSSWENCVLACMACNKRKADRTPEQAKMRMRKKPVRPAWKPLYADHSMRMESWPKFISEAYWNVTLKE